MSIRSNAGSEYLFRSANAPSNTNFTVTGWCRTITNRTGSYRGFVSLTNQVDTTNQELYLGWSDDNNFSVVGTNSTGTWIPAFFSSNPSTTDWVFWALKSSSTASNQTTGYFANLGGNIVSVTLPITRNSWTTNRIHFNATSWVADEWHNGLVAGIKCWDRVLTDAQIVNEMRQLLPVDLTNINFFIPINSNSVADSLIDYSINNRNLSSNGTLDNVIDNPPIPWCAKNRTRLFYFPSVSGVTINAEPVDITSSLTNNLILKERLESPVSLAGGTVAPTLQIEKLGEPLEIASSIIDLAVLKERLEAPLDLIVSIVSPAIGSPIIIDTDALELIFIGIDPLLQSEINQDVLNLIISDVVPTLQIETNHTPFSIAAGTVALSTEKHFLSSPVSVEITIISPATGQSTIVNVDASNSTLTIVTPLIETIYNLTPQDITSNVVANATQIELLTTPVEVISSVVSLTQQLEVNSAPLILTTTLVDQLLEHQINSNIIDLIFSVVDVTTSHTEVGGEITIVVSPDPIEPKNNLFAAFFERLKFINKQNIVSEFVLEETPLPYLSLGQIFNVLSWKNSCLERFEESNFRLSVYAENYDELAKKVNELEQHLIYNTILLNEPKQVISLDQVTKITEELIPQLYRSQLIYEVIVQKHINEIYIGLPTAGETLNKAIYERFKSLPLSKMVNDLVSPGYALENTDYPYLIVPAIRENLDWNHSLGRIDNIKYPLTVISEDLNQLTEIMDEIEKSFDYCKFVINNKNHLINEWMGTEIVELEPQLWRGSVNYEILVESSLSSFR